MAVLRVEKIDHLKAADATLAALIEQVGPYTPEFAPPVFASLARSIVFQQLSTKAASTIYGRFHAALAPGPVDAAGVLRFTEADHSFLCMVLWPAPNMPDVFIEAAMS